MTGKRAGECELASRRAQLWGPIVSPAQKVPQDPMPIGSEKREDEKEMRGEREEVSKRVEDRRNEKKDTVEMRFDSNSAVSIEYTLITYTK